MDTNHLPTQFLPLKIVPRKLSSTDVLVSNFCMCIHLVAAVIAKRLMRRSCKPEVLGSNPSLGWKDEVSLFFFFSFFFSFFFFSTMPLALALGPWQVSLSKVSCQRHKSRYSKSVFTLFFAFLAFLGRFLPPAAKKKNKIVLLARYVVKIFGTCNRTNFVYTKIY